MHNVSIISRLGLNSTGSYGLLQRSTWVEAAGTWNLYWYAPKDQCDEVSPCGANGVCDTNNLPVCSCLRGFTPKSPEAWALRDGRAGCVRSTPLDCQNGTDGFVAVEHAKVPDTERSVVDLGLSLEQCRKACLMNCSCTAYASANVSGGGRGHGAGTGCVMWTTGLTDLRVYPEFGQDLFVRLAAADLGTPSHSTRTMYYALLHTYVYIYVLRACFTYSMHAALHIESFPCVWCSFRPNQTAQKYRRRPDIWAS